MSDHDAMDDYELPELSAQEVHECKDEATAGLYDAEKSPQPWRYGKVLKRGVDIDTLRSLYAVPSTIAHLGTP